MNKIGILGLGWLGMPLALCLQESGKEVRGTTTQTSKQKQLQKMGLNAFNLHIKSNGITGEIDLFFDGIEILIINIPPTISKEDDFSFVTKMKYLICEIERFQIKKVIYISTTSVFEDKESFPTYKESSEPNATSTKALQLIEAEKLIQNIPNTKATVIRFGGLVGGNRHPVNYLAGKENIPNPNAPINLIHQQDCIELITSCIQQNKWSQVFHGVRHTELSKSNFYQFAAKKRNLKPPLFNNQTNSGKNISSYTTQQELRIQFQNEIL